MYNLNNQRKYLMDSYQDMCLLDNHNLVQMLHYRCLLDQYLLLVVLVVEMD
jgi:hypothetical protein